VDGPAVTGRDTGLDAGLDADLAASVGRFRLEVSVRVHAGETVAIVGPNGAGKSTVLRALAGLLPIEAGHVALDGVVLDGGPGGPFVPPHERPIGVVFQDYVLFPHLRALDNVAFGLRSRGVPRRRAAAQARTWLERVGLAEHADRRPSELSGGQAQRIALARALVTEPALLPPSTPPRAPPPDVSSAGSSTATTGSGCSSPTTPSTPPRWPTASWSSTADAWCRRGPSTSSRRDLDRGTSPTSSASTSCPVGPPTVASTSVGWCSRWPTASRATCW
jgi:ABC-type ATPase involved in cell division